MKKTLIFVLILSTLMSLMCPTFVFAEELIPYKNLALNAKTIRNSRYKDTWDADKLVDGSHTTCYSDGGDTTMTDASTIKIPRNSTYTVIDLGTECKIHTIILWAKPSSVSVAPIKNAVIEVTNDPTLQEWTTLDVIEVLNNDMSWRLDFDEPIEYRYVKPGVRPNKSTFTASCFAELEVYGERKVEVKGAEEYNDIEYGTEVYNASKLLYFLDIMKGAEGLTNQFGVNLLMTRADAADIVARSLNNAAASEAELIGNVYSDVTPDTRYGGSIKYCKDLGIVASGEMFYPESYITVEQFMKMVYNAMGYSAYAEALGGYPIGYQALNAMKATKLLPDGVSSKDYLSRGVAAEMIYNALKAPAFDFGVIKTDGIEYSTEKMFLETSFGYVLKRGVVTANNVSTLKTDDSAGKGKVMIDGEEYTDKQELFTDYLGRKVYFLIDDNDEIAGGWTDSETQVLNIYTEDIESVKDGKISVYTEKGKTKKYNISSFSDLNVLKNGVAYNKFTDASFKPTDGRLILIDSEGDGEYETVNIYEPEIIISNYATDNLETKNLVLSGHNKVTKNIDYTNFSIYRRGERVAVDSIGMYNVIYAYISENGKNVVLEINDTIASGVIESVSDESITVKGVKYGVSEYYKAHKSEMDIFPLTAGRDATLLIDEHDRVVWVADMAHSYNNESVGVILASGKTNNALGNYRFKIYDENGEIKIYDTVSDLSIDGVKHSASDIASLISSNPDYFKNMLTFFRVNSEGKISSLRTPNDEDNKEIAKNITITKQNYKTQTAITQGDKVIIPIKDDIVLFTVPVDENGEVLIDGYEKYFGVSTFNKSFGTGAPKMTTDVDLYGKGDYGEPYYAIMKTKFDTRANGVRPITKDSDMSTVLVEKVNKVLSDSGNTCVYIEGYNIYGGQKVKVTFEYTLTGVIDSCLIHCAINEKISGTAKKDWYLESILDLDKVNSAGGMNDLLTYCSDISDLKKGDIICYRLAGDEGCELERIYNYEYFNGNAPYGLIYCINSGVATSFVSQRRLVHYNVSDINAELVSLSDGAEVKENIFYDNVNVKAFLVGDKTVELITADEFPTHIQKGYDAVLYSTSGTYKTMIFYEN